MRAAALILAAVLGGGAAGAVTARLTQPIAPAQPSASPAPAASGRTGVPEVIALVRPSIVAIDVVATTGVGRRTSTQKGAGTGIILTADGLLATNAHVVAGAQQISVTLSDGSSEDAALVGADAAKDLALLRISRAGLAPVTFGRSAALRVGDLVVAVGNALALAGGPTASLGIVSALGRNIETQSVAYRNLIQTDAAINAGDSGGPLVDERGRVVGINTVASFAAENVGFAIAIDDAAAVFDTLRAQLR